MRIPLDTGYRRLVWVLPVAALLGAAGVLVAVARRSSAQHRAPTAPAAPTRRRPSVPTTSINPASTMSWMSSTSRRRLVYPAVVLAVAAAVGGYATWSGGRSSVGFLVFATLALGWVVWLAFRAAQALVKDGPVVDAGAAVTGKRRKELEREKQSLLKALKELDFDHQMGKVSDKDFADISATYRARAIRVMRQLDDAGRDYETMIAAEVGKRLQQPSAVSASAVSACSRKRTSATSAARATTATRSFARSAAASS